MPVKVVEPKVKQIEEPKLTTIPDGFIEVTGLPSKMKLYPEGTKIYSRSLKLLEVKKLSSMTSENFNDVINTILKDTVKGIAVEDLITSDKFYLIFWQRANTYRGDGFSVDFKCPSCETASKYDFDISSIEIKDIAEDYDPTTEYEIGSHKYVLGQLTVRDEQLMLNYGKNNKMKDLDEDILLLSAVLRTIDGQKVNLTDKYNHIVDLDPSSFVQLHNAYKKNEISVIPEMKVKCKACGEVVETPLNFRPEFFLPTYQS